MIQGSTLGCRGYFVQQVRRVLFDVPAALAELTEAKSDSVLAASLAAKNRKEKKRKKIKSNLGGSLPCKLCVLYAGTPETTRWWTRLRPMGERMS